MEYTVKEIVAAWQLLSGSEVTSEPWEVLDHIGKARGEALLSYVASECGIPRGRAALVMTLQAASKETRGGMTRMS